jgi:peptide/nickel transport system permease protein
VTAQWPTGQVGDAMSQLFITRGLQAIFTLWVVSVAVFFAARITGSPDQALMPLDALPEDREAFRKLYGLDQPLIVQYGR